MTHAEILRVALAAVSTMPEPLRTHANEVQLVALEAPDPLLVTAYRGLAEAALQIEKAVALLETVDRDRKEPEA